jgi:hypothetical protein
MQYSANLNLLAAYQHFPELDANDLIVFDCIKKYSQSVKVKRQIDGGQMYFWFNWTVVKEQLPIIKSNSRRSIDAHIAALCNVGLLERHPDNKAKATSFYKLGENCDKLDFAEVTKEDYAAKTAKPEPLQNSPDLCKILPSSDIVAEPLQNSAKPLQDFAKPLQEMEKVEGETFAKSCKTFAKSCKHIIHIDSNTVDNKLSTDKHREEAREIFEEKSASQNLVEVADHVAEITQPKNTKKKAQEVADYRNFDEECENRGFSKIAKIPKRYTSQQMAAKIAEVGVGEAIFWTMIERVECYLCENPKKKYQNLPAVVITWFGTADENAIKNALNSFWREKYKADYQILTNWSEAQKTAIKSISSQLKHAIATRANKIIDKVSTGELQSAAKTFFSELPEKWANLKWFKLENIANDFSAIMAVIKDEREKAKKAKAQVQEEQPKEKTFGEKCAEILQGVTPAVAADVAQRLAQPTRFNFTQDVSNKAIKALGAMVAWASENNRAISSDIDTLFDIVDDFYTHIKNKKDAATK